MYKVKITALRKADYKDLQKLLELPLEIPCTINEGDVFIYNGDKPLNFCDSAWDSIKEFVIKLSNGEGKFYGDWMKNPYSALISCNDGFRPVSFLLERIEE